MRSSRTTSPPVAVACIGNRDRGDDGAGHEVARLLAAEPLDGANVVEIGGDCVSLLDVFDHARAVVIVDAVKSGAPVGTVHRVDAAARPLPFATAGTSSHALGVGEVIELGRVLNRLPATLVVVGIETAVLDVGSARSRNMPAAVRQAAALVRQEVCAALRRARQR